MTDLSNVETNRRQFVQLTAAGLAATGAGMLSQSAFANGAPPKIQRAAGGFAGGPIKEGSVVADPTNIPSSVDWDTPRSHDVELVATRVEAEVMPGVKHRFMTFNGQIPAPMIRVRQGDTLNVTVTNRAENESSHSVDLHAVIGTGGGGHFTEVAPGKSKSFSFKALNPGAFIYHCGVSNLDEHISRGMFGMILVEPEYGLPPVDREFYIGQHELYTKSNFGVRGDAEFNGRAMLSEAPNYVLFNGAVASLTGAGYGAMKAAVGETVRVYMVCGGPNLTSSFHPIGNIWSRCWPQGGLANEPLKYIQTWPVSPGSCFVGDMALPVPQTVTLVDHAVSRVVNKGLAAQIEVSGDPNPEILNAG